MRDRGSSANASTGPNWRAVVVDVPYSLEEPLVAITAGSAIGAEFTALGSDHGRLQIFAATDVEATWILERVRRVLAGAGLDPGTGRLRVEIVSDGRWVERYQAGLRPFELCEGFIVDPAGEGSHHPGAITINLVPGRAFGTGEHATTRLCAGSLVRRVRAGSRWLDLGCGSGILSLVAHHCGAGTVCAVDIDPVAVEVGRKVMLANGVDQGVEFREGSCAAVRGGIWDGIVANIEAKFFLEQASALRSLLRPDSVLLVGGVLVEQADEVTGALRDTGLYEVERTELEGWCLLAVGVEGPR